MQYISRLPPFGNQMTLLPRTATTILSLILALSHVVLNVVPAHSEALADSGRLKSVLSDSWKAYQKRFIQEDGRVIDRAANDVTTSEGQSYAMLRAVWMDDRATFERAWAWTKANLKRPDLLFAWKWGKRHDDTWAQLETDSAGDADQDIAFALLMASKQWKSSAYFDEASALLADIWDKETLVINNRRYLLPGTWAAIMPRPKLNPSYFAPYAYRIFAKADTTHDWQSLISPGYDLLQDAGKLSRLGLPPDWVLIDPASSKLELEDEKSSKYSYDAMRVPWRVALDWQWNSEERAMDAMKSISFLHDSWRQVGTIRGAYSVEGVMNSFDEPRAGFGCVLPMFGILYPESAKRLLQERIMAYYYHGLWSPEDDYYAQNWVWFGIGAYLHMLNKPAF